MTDETTPDAVSLVHELLYAASQQGPEETDQVADRLLSAIHAERARHAEEVAALRGQLRRVEGERDRMQRANETLAVRMDLPASQLLMVGSELCGDGKIDPNDHRDPRWTPTLQQAAKVMRELTSLRALLPDARACAEYVIGEGGEGECLDRSDARGVAGDRCESGNECGRLGCPECQS